MFLTPPVNLLSARSEPPVTNSKETSEPPSSDVHLVLLHETQAALSAARRGRRRSAPEDLSTLTDASELESFTVEALRDIGRRCGVEPRNAATRDEIIRALRYALFPRSRD